LRLATFQSPTGPQAAVVASDETLVPVAGLVVGAPSDMLGLIDAGPGLWDRIRDAASGARGGTPVRTARLLAPIPRPRRNVLCVGWNYVEHFEEGKSMRGAGAPQDMPKHPAFFSKQPNAVIGHGAEVWYSGHVSPQLDWEVELAAIIGASGRDIPESEALKHVFGYTVGNDVSVRDVQRDWHGGQWFKGKSFDTSCPLGPWIVTADELGDQQDLKLQLRVNGVVKQDSTTKAMYFQVPAIINELSAGMALEPGDVIMTGTPPGVGVARKPPEFLQVGDVMEAEIERIGVLRNAIGRGPTPE
jgi:2-keto-4-pentenoate hydratase/2-oxohepta-3-ene-1,7-dioic acid hydratase in catechol pathway